MRIHSISKTIAVIPIIAVLLIILFGFGNYSSWTVWIFVPIVMIVMLYTFSGQIDYWWLQKFPIALDGKLKQWLVQYQPSYVQYSNDDQKKYDERLMLYLEAREFKSVGTHELKDVPYDIKGVIASQAIRIGLHQNDFLLGDLDRIYFYKHPFPTPKYQQLHTVEIDEEDGILILALDYAIAGITKPKEYFNLALYGYAMAFARLFPDCDYPIFEENYWSTIFEVTHFSEAAIKDTIGLLPINSLALHITIFFDHKEAYKEKFPLYYQQFAKIFI